MSPAVYFPLDPGPFPQSTDLHGWFVSSGYVWRNGAFHPAYDLYYPGCTGAAIRMPGNGLVNQMWDPGGGGNWTNVWLDGGGLMQFGHASIFDDPDGPGPARSWNGRRAAAGTVIAYVGNTGHSSGPHVHVVWRPDGRNHVDPGPLLRSLPLFTGTSTIPAPGGPTKMIPHNLDGRVFVLVPRPGTPRGFAWQAIGSPTDLDDLYATGAVDAGKVVTLGKGGAQDARFERYPVLAPSGQVEREALR